MLDFIVSNEALRTVSEQEDRGKIEAKQSPKMHKNFKMLRKTERH